MGIFHNFVIIMEKVFFFQWEKYSWRILSRHSFKLYTSYSICYLLSHAAWNWRTCDTGNRDDSNQKYAYHNQRHHNSQQIRRKIFWSIPEENSGWIPGEILRWVHRVPQRIRGRFAGVIARGIHKGITEECSEGNFFRTS